MADRRDVPKLRAFQTCEGRRVFVAFMVPSKSRPDAEHEVEIEFTDGTVNCSCPAFRYRGTCSHTRFREERCGWNELESNVAQTREQKRRNICPLCGSRTALVARGDFRG